MSERYIVAIEIGSSKIRGAVATVDDSGMVDVLAVEEEKIVDSVRYGCIQNVEVNQAIAEVCERLEAYPRLHDGTITGVYVALGGKSLSSRNVEVSMELPAEMEITQQLVNELKAKAENLIDPNRDVVAVVPVRFTVDNKAQVNPVGSYGQTLGARMAVVSCIPQIKRMLRRVIVERLEFNINDYIVRPLAEADVVITDDERRLGCMFVDFGAETTTVAIYKNGAPVYLATLPMGSRNITLDLTTLNYIEERAEEIKRVSGNAMPQEGVRRTGADGIDYTEVNNFVHARASEIVHNIIAQMKYAELKPGDLPGGIIIVGGGARLRGFNDLLAELGQMKVRMGAVQGMVRISDGAAHPADTLDVISVLMAAARLPEKECVEFPVEEDEDEPSRGDGSYGSMYDDSDEDDEDVSRIGHLDEDEEERREREKRALQKAQKKTDKKAEREREKERDRDRDRDSDDDSDDKGGWRPLRGLTEKLNKIWSGDNFVD